MQKLNDLSRSLTALELDSTLIAVIEMSLSSWLVAGIVPGIERQPLKKLAVDEQQRHDQRHQHWNLEREPGPDRRHADGQQCAGEHGRRRSRHHHVG